MFQRGACTRKYSVLIDISPLLCLRVRIGLFMVFFVTVPFLVFPWRLRILAIVEITGTPLRTLQTSEGRQNLSCNEKQGIGVKKAGGRKAAEEYQYNVKFVCQILHHILNYSYAVPLNKGGFWGLCFSGVITSTSSVQVYNPLAPFPKGDSLCHTSYNPYE